MVSLVTSYQINFLRAILYGHVNEVGRKEIIDKFNLGSSANVATIKKALQKKEIIEINGKEISFTDPIFIHWLKQNRQMLL